MANLWIMSEEQLHLLTVYEGFTKKYAWSGSNLMMDKDDCIARLNINTSQLSLLDASQLVWRDLLEPTGTPTDNPPSNVTGLSVSSIYATYVNLSWNAATDDNGVVKYHLYKRYSGGSTWSYTGYSTTGTSFALTGLVCGTAYEFAVKAEDTIGQLSTSYSNVATGTTASCGTSRSSFASRNVQGRTSAIACSQTTNTTYWHDGAQPHPTYGDRIYTSSTGSDTLIGEESLWWKIGLTIPAAMQVDENGYLYSIQYC